jgi:hypothetical protein
VKIATPIGERFGMLTVVDDAPALISGDQRRRCVSVRCDCGTAKSAVLDALRRGLVVSCGCHRRQVVIDRNTTHGLAHKVPEYRVWLAMRERCSDPNNKFYRRYGGRGIRVCARWQADFAAFYEDMGPRPGDRWSIDRIDNDGNYEPGNCRWATAEQQRANRGDGRAPIYDQEELELIIEASETRTA